MTLLPAGPPALGLELGADASVSSLRSAVERILEGTSMWNRDRIRRDAEERFAPIAHAEPLSAFLSDFTDLR